MQCSECMDYSSGKKRAHRGPFYLFTYRLFTTLVSDKQHHLAPRQRYIVENGYFISSGDVT